MLKDLIRAPFRLLLPGLLLAACGGVPESGLAPAAEEPLGTRESALCTGLYVDTLSIEGISSYQGEAAGTGQWAVSPGSNAVRLEYYVDGTETSTEDRVGTSGPWYFSASPIGCGPHSFEVRAYPMVIDSAGNRTTCLTALKSNTASFDQYCPPTATMSCGRVSNYLRCNGTASGGSYAYTRYWQTVTTDLDVQDDPFESAWTAGLSTKDFYCPPISAGANSYYYVQVRYKVVDSVGTSTDVISTQNFKCARL